MKKELHISKNKILNDDAEFRKWARNEYGKRNTNILFWSTFKQPSNSDSTLRLTHSSHGVKITRAQSTEDINLYEKLKLYEKQRDSCLQNKIMMNKIINNVEFEDVPLWWGNNKHKIKVPKPMSVYVKSRKR